MPFAGSDAALLFCFVFCAQQVLQLLSCANLSAMSDTEVEPASTTISSIEEEPPQAVLHCDDGNTETVQSSAATSSSDAVFTYAMTVMELGLLFLQSEDLIREGDGPSKQHPLEDGSLLLPSDWPP